MPHPSWIDFLTQQGLPQDPASPSAPATEQSLLLIPLTEQTLISLEGPDAEKFLQGQLSCDLNRLSTAQSLLGANCTHKGMVLSVSRLYQRAQGSLLMRLPAAIAEAALANLKKFAVFSKVSIELADGAWVGLGLIGEHAPDCLRRIGIEPPAEVNQQVIAGERILARVPGNLPRFELWCPLDQAPQLWQQLATETSLGSSQTWRAAEIEAGLVQLGPDSLESYIPQMLNLQAVEGISFNKGCYTGQEIVTRLQFRGKLKKLMYAATVDIDSLNGETVTSDSLLFSGSGRSVGKLLSCAHQGPKLLLQAVISKTAADTGDLHLHHPEGAAVTLLPLPYPIDPELFERPER